MFQTRLDECGMFIRTGCHYPIHDPDDLFSSSWSTMRKLVVEEQTESWQLRSGTWYRERRSESWRLASTAIGTVVNAKLPAPDVGRMIGARRDTASGQWFPSDFDYSPQTGDPLHVSITSLDSPWVPPFGAPALCYVSRSRVWIRPGFHPLAQPRSPT